MLDSPPDAIAIWTEEGRDDAAADILLTPVEGEGLRVEIGSVSAPLTYAALYWKTSLPEAARILGDHWERGYGDLEWRGIMPERVLPWYALIHDPKTGATQGYGVETGAGSFASWRVEETGVTLVLDLRSGGMGVHLGRRTLSAATIRTLTSEPDESPFVFACRFCRALCPAPRLPAHPVYGGNDWYFRYGNITTQTVQQDAGLIRELAPRGNNDPTYVIDAGWFPEAGCNGGPYDRGNAGFPDMPGLAAWMRSQEIRPGIWIRPLLTAEKVSASWRVPERHPHGREASHYLDPTVPDVLERVRDDMARLSAWGYEVIKHDFTTYDLLGRWGFQMGAEVTSGGWAFADRSRTNAEIIHRLYTVLREAAGEATLIGCNTVGHLGAGLFELQRTGDDTSGKHWERTRKMGVNTLAFRMPQHGAFFAADADCVGLTHAIPWDQNRQWLDAVARSGTPLFVSADPDALGPEQRAALSLAFAQAAQPTVSAEPLDWMQTTCPRHWRFDTETVPYDWSGFAGSAFACPP